MKYGDVFLFKMLRNLFNAFDITANGKYISIKKKKSYIFRERLR